MQDVYGDRFRGILIGGAVGDSLGLPLEGLAPRRARRLFPPPWRQRLVFGYGMISDDTEHALFVAQSLLRHPDSVERFGRRLAWCLRGWLAGLPAGIGLATLRATMRLCAGFSPRNSGVVSAGNGPAMRVAPIGAFFADQPDRMAAYVEMNTVITHRDPRALTGASAIAALSAWVVRENLHRRPSLEAFGTLLRSCDVQDSEWCAAVDTIVQCAKQGDSVAECARRLGLEQGVSGYIYHTVPIVAYAWFKHFGDFRQTVQAVLSCGGDADTTAAIAGALAGAVVGEQGIPVRWSRGLRDWPRSVALLRTVADRLAQSRLSGNGEAAVAYCWPALGLRNLIFLLIVLSHGLRRLLPPY